MKPAWNQWDTLSTSHPTKIPLQCDPIDFLVLGVTDSAIHFPTTHWDTDPAPATADRMRTIDEISVAR